MLYLSTARLYVVNNALTTCLYAAFRYGFLEINGRNCLAVSTHRFIFLTSLYCTISYITSSEQQHFEHMKAVAVAKGAYTMVEFYSEAEVVYSLNLFRFLEDWQEV